MKSRETLRIQLRHFLIVTLATAMLAVTSCSLDNPGMPKWDVNFAVPLNSQWYGLDSLVSRPDEIAENGGGIDVYESGLLRFYYEEPIDSVVLADSLTRYEPEDTTKETSELGIIAIDSTQEAHGQMSLDAFVPGFNGAGFYDFTPLFIVANTQINIDPLNNFHQADVVPGGGFLYLEVTNSTNLTWNEITVDVTTADPGNPSLGTLVYTNLHPGESQQQSIDLSGSSLKQNIVLFAEGSGPQQAGVYVEAEDGVEFVARVSPLDASFYKGVIIKQDPERDTTLVDFDEEENWITEALANAVTMRFQIENYTETEDSVYVKLPSITDADAHADTLTLGFYLPAPELGQECVCLDTFVTVYDKYLQMDLPEGYNTPTPDPQSMDVLVTIVVLSGGFDAQGNPLIREVSSSDTVVTTMTVESFDFEWLWGSAKEEEVELDRTEVEIDVWEDTEDPDLQRNLTGNVALDAAQIVIDLRGSQFQAPAKLVLDITAVNSSLGDIDQNITEHFERWLDPEQQYAIIGGAGDADSAKVVSLLNHFPDQLVIEGTALMGREPMMDSPWDPYEPYMLHKNDQVIGKAILEAPLSLTVDEATTMHAPVADLSEGLEPGLQEAGLYAYITNTVPLGGTLYLLAGSFSDEAMAQSELVLDNLNRYSLIEPMTIRAPEVDPSTGRASATLLDTVGVAISDQGINLLQQDNLYLRQIVRIDPTPCAIRAYVQDGIDVALVIEGVYRVNEEE